MTKTKTVLQNADMRLFEAKGKETIQESVRSPSIMFFCHILIPFHVLMEKDLQ